MSSKRVQDPCEKKARQGRCCRGSKCSRAVQESYADLLQDEASFTFGKKIGGEAEGEQEPRTNVHLGVGTTNTSQHKNMHIQGREHCGADRRIHHTAATKVTTALSNLNNQGGVEGATPRVGTAEGGKEKQAGGEKQAAVQQAEDPECRLCGGCHKAKSREEFAAHEWQKADAWFREAARQCQEL